MEYTQETELIKHLTDEVEKLLPLFMSDPIDKSIADGNLAFCVVTGEGHISGKMFGTDVNRQRGSCRIAMQKAMQVWITGVATGKYEQLVYSNALDWQDYGIPKPEFIGWDGGLPAEFSDGTKLAIAFSGFRGEMDCEIIRKAVKEVPGISLIE
ncbi:MAG: hypothetical protein CVU44_18375 [Chloroflexi bacterium HGW-Chloroflexi-6]|nr:MAG: hypothetical protein CVU44_18375 [Chloroflexi bacterium HGW-Chloroflexi-6]